MEGQTTNDEKPKMKLGIPASILVAGLMVSFAIYFTGTHKISTTPVVTPGAPIAPAAVDVKDVNISGDAFIGDPNAPITMIYWSDYQCPFCKKTETEVVPTLKTNYVDTGKMKIVFKNFVFLGPDSVTAALFDKAVWQAYPAQYFTWREAMYKAQDDEGSVGFGDRASIEKLVQGIPGMDQAKVSALVDANTTAYQTAVDADYAEGQKFGVQGTPAVIIGTTAIDGAQPLAAFTAAIVKAQK